MLSSLSISTLTNNVHLHLNTLSLIKSSILCFTSQYISFNRLDVRHVQYYGLNLGLLTIVFTLQGKHVELTLNARYVRQIEL